MRVAGSLSGPSTRPVNPPGPKRFSIVGAARLGPANKHPEFPSVWIVNVVERLDWPPLRHAGSAAKSKQVRSRALEASGSPEEKGIEEAASRTLERGLLLQLSRDEAKQMSLRASHSAAFFQLLKELGAVAQARPFEQKLRWMQAQGMPLALLFP
jgi:hypothetical protein